nr:synaptobrevin, longin-like domain protein [Tanacetum cinerariifolium]
DSPLLGVHTPRSDEDILKLMELMIFLLKKGVCDEFGLNAARLSKLLLSSKCDVTRLQALVNKKRIVITEEVVCEILQLYDAEGVICLPNEEIFAGLARMGYEKPSTKLTFYKAFFSTRWKFFIHTILHSLSVKRTSWNEFSSAMASALICLSSGQRFNFSKYIFESLPKTLTITAAPAVSTRRKKGVVIRDPKEELQYDTPSREEMEKEDEEIIKSINETPT